ncbi:hypothetical protein MANES_13G021301v8 [Manihot esculenta]|uniref:Uncharacterized protein n=1 Tax=Manihot esculenta TaxID=3983 RepID=A0ACB7GMW6_MANES|nr:hypothetical protein MANES_13G021301v8 [Manihot esculenta]
MFPRHSDKNQRSHDPRLDSKYHSPWILPKQYPDEDNITLQQNRPADEDQHPRQPKRSRTKKSQDQDHYPIHYGLPPAQQQQQVSSVTLNAAYVDAGSLLNADISVLANFTNPNDKVRLPLGDVARLQEQINQNGIIFNIKAMFRVRSQLGSLFAYSNRLYGQCFIMVTAPPTGVLRAARCSTKR